MDQAEDTHMTAGRCLWHGNIGTLPADTRGPVAWRRKPRGGPGPRFWTLPDKEQ